MMNNKLAYAAALLAAACVVRADAPAPAVPAPGGERAAMDRNTALLAANLLISRLRDAYAKRAEAPDFYAEMLAEQFDDAGIRAWYDAYADWLTRTLCDQLL